MPLNALACNNNTSKDYTSVGVCEHRWIEIMVKKCRLRRLSRKNSFEFYTIITKTDNFKYFFLSFIAKNTTSLIDGLNICS